MILCTVMMPKAINGSCTVVNCCAAAVHKDYAENPAVDKGVSISKTEKGRCNGNGWKKFDVWR